MKLAIDGKQDVIINGYAVATLSLFVCSEYVSQTRDARARESSRPKVRTLKQEPFAQAMMSTESAENVSQFFVTAADLAKQCCGLDLHKQVWQLHKDYAKAWKQPGKPISQQQDHAMTMRTCGGLPTSSWRNYSAPSCLRPRLYMLQRERMITIGGFSRKRRPSSRCGIL